jgi:hypothetical protein
MDIEHQYIHMLKVRDPFWLIDTNALIAQIFFWVKMPEIQEKKFQVYIWLFYVCLRNLTKAFCAMCKNTIYLCSK